MEQHAYHHPYPPHAATMGAAPDDPMLLARLRAQVEFYFSPQNLSRDTFLRGLLEQNDNAVSVETIATFPKVRELHAIGRLGMMNMPQSAMPPADPMLLCRALEGSLVVTVSNDGQWIHLGGATSEHSSLNQHQHQHGKATPNQESSFSAASAPPSSPSSPSTTASSAGVPTHPIYIKERTTVIVHDVPEGTTVHDVMAFFSTRYFQPKSAAAANHDGTCWEVDFYSESDAVAALSNTQNETIHGMPIRASLKQNERAPPPHSVHAQMPVQQQQQHGPQQHHHHPQQYAPQQNHSQEHQQQYAYPPTIMQGYAVYEYHPYYGVPVMQPQQQQVHYGYGAPPGHYASSQMYPPHLQQQQQQQQQQQNMLPPNNNTGYAHPSHHGYTHPPHQHQQQQYPMDNYSHQNSRPYSKKKNKGKGKGGNYNRDYSNYDRSNNTNNERPNNYERSNNNNYERQGDRERTNSNYERSNNNNNNYDRPNNHYERPNNNDERDYRQAKNGDQNDGENAALASRKEDTTVDVNTDGKKRNARKNKKKNRTVNETTLGQENFPALVENGVKNKQQSSIKAPPKGYAAALKKKSTAAAPPLSSGESTYSQTEQLEQHMSNLNVSKQTVEPEFWRQVQDDVPAAPDVW